MSGHTPGPWVFLEEGRTEDIYNRCEPLTICSGGSVDLAIVLSVDDSTVDTTREQAIANARLIAAAPELLAACEAVSAHYSGSLDHQPPHVAIARAAIAKATGAA